MKGRYAVRMAEIESLYGADAMREKEREKEQKAKAEAAKKAKEKRREEEKFDEVDFESGFDHGFARMSTFNGKAVGKDDGPSTSISNVAAAA